MGNYIFYEAKNYIDLFFYFTTNRIVKEIELSTEGK